MLGLRLPAWDAFRRALEQLAHHVAAERPAVLDASWCAWPPMDAVAKGAERFYGRRLAGRLRRLGPRSVLRPRAAPEGSYVAQFFVEPRAAGREAAAR